ncbi:MAG TPA: futalosine hydrolase, partial [Puia sp.]|nr:futalosine hydrolase [Puia sp.]
MHILLAAATTFEIQPTIEGGWSQVLITGVGGVATTWSLMRQIGIHRPDLIVQAGIGGCFTDAKPGTVFAIREDELADLGVWENESFLTLSDLGLADVNRLPNPYHDLLAFTGLPEASALTINEITTDPRRIAWYRQNRDAVVESMEGGPLHYVCLRENIPFLQLRSISNTVGVRDKTKWDIRLAITRLNEQLTRILHRLSSADPSLLT